MKSTYTRIILMFSLLLAPAISKGATIFSENFESSAVGTYGVSQTIGAFTVTSGSIDVVGPGFFPELCVAPEASHCADLDGSSQGAMESTLALNLTPGNVYTLSFDLNGSQRGISTSSTVSLGSVFTHTYLQNSSDTSSVVVSGLTVSVPTTAFLTFASNTPGDVGSLLDNVTVSQTAVTPEPGSLLLFAGAISALIAGRRWRKQ